MTTKQKLFWAIAGMCGMILPFIVFSTSRASDSVNKVISFENFITICIILVLLQLISILLLNSLPKLSWILSAFVFSLNIPLTAISTGLLLIPFQKIASLLITFNIGLYLLALSYKTKTKIVEDKKPNDNVSSG